MKRSDAYARADSLFSCDKGAMGEECKKVLQLDLERTLQEYFDIIEPPVLEISGDEGEFAVRILFSASRVKDLYGLKE